MLTVKEAAKTAGVCEGVVRAWVASGKLPHFRLGRPGRRGKIVIASEDLSGFLTALRTGGQVVKPKPRPPETYKHFRVK